MKESEWMRFCLENRISEKQKNIMLVRRINKNHEKRLVDCFTQREKEIFITVALDTTRRHTLNFAIDDYKGGVMWIEYSKKEKRWTNIYYEEHGCWHYIFLKHCIFLKR